MAHEDGIDREAIARLWGSPGDATYRRVLAAYMEELDALLAAIHAHGGDRMRLVHAAHALRGASANVGADAVAQAAGAIETAARTAAMPALATLIAELDACLRRGRPVLEDFLGGPA